MTDFSNYITMPSQAGLYGPITGLNNPGALPYDAFAQKTGATEVDPVSNYYAIYPDYATGRAALATLFFTIYGNGTILYAVTDMLAKRVTMPQFSAGEGLPAASIARTLGNAADADETSDLLQTFTTTQKTALLDAYQKLTGYLSGNATPGGGTVVRVTLPRNSRL